MGKDRLKKYSIIAFKIYIFAIIVWFLLVMLSSYFWYFEDGSISDFCIHVVPNSGEYYHYKYNEDNACLIDWIPFLQEAVFLPLILMSWLLYPAFVALYFLKRNKS